jgi:hypothetical protein
MYGNEHRPGPPLTGRPGATMHGCKGLSSFTFRLWGCAESPTHARLNVFGDEARHDWSAPLLMASITAVAEVIELLSLSSLMSEIGSLPSSSVSPAPAASLARRRSRRAGCRP